MLYFQHALFNLESQAEPHGIFFTSSRIWKHVKYCVSATLFFKIVFKLVRYLKRG
jgi:hypothetical protein